MAEDILNKLSQQAIELGASAMAEFQMQANNNNNNNNRAQMFEPDISVIIEEQNGGGECGSSFK